MRLCHVLIPMLRDRGFFSAYAVITLPNAGSGLHEKTLHGRSARTTSRKRLFASRAEGGGCDRRYSCSMTPNVVVLAPWLDTSELRELMLLEAQTSIA
jgi:hypothetical protein